jgi:hypothetical protein
MKKLILISLLLITTSILFSQKAFKEGYVLVTNGDTIYGFIENNSFYQNSISCAFKFNQEGPITVYKPGEIAGYRFVDGKFYVSKEYKNETYFFEYLINGILSIYIKQDQKLRNQYFIEKEPLGLTELVYSSTIVTDADGIQRQVKSREHNAILSQYTSDYPELRSNAMRIESPTTGTLVSFAREYHEAVCLDRDCIIYEKKKKGDIEFEVLSGVSHVFSNLDNYIPEKTFFTAGFRFNFMLPQASEFLYLGIGLNFNYLYPEKILLEKIPQSVTLFGDTIFLRIYETQFNPKLQLPITIMYNNHRPGISPVFGLSINLLRKFDFESFCGLNYQRNLFGIKLIGEYKVFPVDTYAHSAAIKVGLSYKFKEKS